MITSLLSRALMALTCFFALPLTSLPAAAQSGAAPEDMVQVELLEGWRHADGSHMAGLLIRLSPGWKTYWRAPGEAGIPPRLQLRDRAGLLSADLHWPVPEVFHSNGMQSIGYSSDVVFPLELTLADGTGALRLAGRIDLGVCHDICVPVSVSLRGTLPAGGHPDPRIAAALADRPLSAAEAGAGRVSCDLTPIRDGLRVEARIPLPRQGSDETVVFELPDPAIWISEAMVERSGNILTASADIVPPDAGPFAMDRSSLRMTVLAGGSAVELTGCQG
ncbi:protein-disulfide reductase DsbD domain-containing protein [Nioella aestuarii]|uniref:protein-disulfide reductase DsbD domain-containing protein n=1 Tax=Nioella aestuarii TaxID=1662864 RepID=UPI003D7FBB33